MNKKTFAKCLVLPILAGAFVAGCQKSESVPVRDTRPAPTVQTSPVATPPVVRAGEHVVNPGETLFGISRQYGVSVQDLAAWNNITRPEQISVGQILRVAAPETQAVAKPLTPDRDVSFAPLPEVRREPRGGREAWSEEAWARLQPQPTIIAPIPPAVPPTPGTEPGAPTEPRPEAPSRPEFCGAEGWMWPVKGPIINRFNDPVPGGDGRLRNRGIGISGTPGTPVLAAACGKVVYAGSALRGLGNMVIIKHDGEYLTAYAHNRVILVKEADTVSRGQKIAELGDSDADQPKLHFELRKNGQPIDPLRYLPEM